MSKTTIPFDPRPRALENKVRLTKGKKSVVVNAIIDTGATSTVLDLSLARRLGMGKNLVRTVSALQVRGRLTEFRGFIDKLELLGLGCSIGPVVVRFTRFGLGSTMLLGMDIMSHLKVKVDLTPERAILSCESPKSLVEVFTIARGLGYFK